MSQNTYADHIATLQARSAVALARAGREHLLIAAGVQKYHFLDDRPYPFQVNPHFKHWLPLTEHPHCWLSITPGEKPVLVYYQPDDYWHLPPETPAGFWVDHFDIRIVADRAQIAAHLPPAARCAIIGEADAAEDGHVPDNPAAVLDYLHYHRAFKTPWELEQMRVATQRAVRGHRAAEAAFRAGASELGIHRAYLEATGHSDFDLPYTNIIGLNEHGAVLHYQHLDAQPPARSRSFLIDAGAQHNGYAADITRSHGDGDADFAAVLAAMETVQLQLVDGVRAGQDYVALHRRAHHLIAGVLRDLDIVRMTPEAMVDSGVSNVFFPHGLGHLLGLQVHDVAGFQPGEDGGHVAAPEQYPALRLTRTLAAGMVVTIEPGLYFIDTLLRRLRAGPHGKALNEPLIAHLRQFGGVRIEDDVACTGDAPENLTRDAWQRH